MTTEQFHPEWDEWYESGVRTLGRERTAQLAMLVADAAYTLKVTSSEESKFVLSGIVMLMEQCRKFADSKVNSIGRS